MSNTNPTLGGLEVLVAAASAANSNSNSMNAGKRKRGQGNANRTNGQGESGNGQGSMSDGQGEPSMRQTQNALLEMLTNPVFISALAAATQSAANIPGANTSSPYHQLPPQQNHDTAWQQTRSGRISRPPVQPQYDVFQMFSSNGNMGMNGNGANLNIDPIFNTAPPAQYNFQNGGGDASWGAQTLAEVSHGQGQGQGAEGNDREDENGSLSPQHEDSMESGLPMWPLPPGGKGGRKGMPKDEMLARRRARNRLAAIESRKKRKHKMTELEVKMKEKEDGYMMLQLQCRRLEQQVEQLQQVITSAGLSLPPELPAANPVFTPATFSPAGFNMNFTGGTNETPAFSVDESLPPLDMFFNIDNMDMDGEDDGEFLPPSSPAGESDAEGRSRKGKGKKRGGEDDDDDEFEDDEVEDEDLFLPIEDVPVPPDAQMESAMRILGVDNQEQLSALVNKMVTAGKDGMTPEMVDKLKVLIGLVGPEGQWFQSS